MSNNVNYEREFIKSCFDYDHDLLVFKCKLDGDNCPHIIKSKTLHLNNSRKHLVKYHKDSFQEDLRKFILNKEKSRPDIFKCFPSLQKTEIVFRISKESFLKNIVDLTTVHGRPFSIIEDKAFKELVKPYTTAFNLTLNRKNVKEHIVYFSSELKKKIIDCLETDIFR